MPRSAWRRAEVNACSFIGATCRSSGATATPPTSFTTRVILRCSTITRVVNDVGGVAVAPQHRLLPALFCDVRRFDLDHVRSGRLFQTGPHSQIWPGRYPHGGYAGEIPHPLNPWGLDRDREPDRKLQAFEF